MTFDIARLARRGGPFVNALLAGLVGAVVAHLINAPMPWLIGAMAGTAAFFADRKESGGLPTPADGNGGGTGRAARQFIHAGILPRPRRQSHNSGSAADLHAPGDRVRLHHADQDDEGRSRDGFLFPRFPEASTK